MNFSEKLIRLRKREGISQEELASYLEVSRQAVSRWEQGTALPDAGNLLKLRQRFGVSLDWLLEEGRLTRDEVLVQRFEQLFRELGVDHSGKAISERYEGLLSRQHDFMPGAEQLLKDLSSRYDLYLASNGAAAVQNPRLDDAGLRPYFKGIFISEEMGADKPSKAFFDACFAAIPGFRLEETVMVGDSLTSDIRGGSNTGLRTVWFNPHGKEPRPDIRPSYTIHALSELLPLLASTQ